MGHVRRPAGLHEVRAGRTDACGKARGATKVPQRVESPAKPLEKSLHNRTCRRGRPTPIGGAEFAKQVAVAQS